MAVTEALKKDSVERLTRMVSLLGFRAEVTPEETDEALVLNLTTEEAGRLIGRKGHCLQALELLLDRMLRKEHGEGTAVAISIDGYRYARDSRDGGDRRGGDGRRGGDDRRSGGVDEDRLHGLAADAAKEVKRWGEPRRLGPFNAAERRAVHMALRDDPAVHTESEEPDAEGRKCVVISLAKGAGA